MTAGFRNRHDAGRLLAESLAKYAGRHDVIVVAISSGGMIVALEVAQAIRSPIEMLVTQPIRVPMHDPWQETQAMGALASGGARPFADVRNRIVILADETIDAPESMCAGIEAMRERNARFVVVAAPMGSARACRQIASKADEVVCLTQWETACPPPSYEGCPPVSDEEVRGLLGGSLGRGASEAVSAR